MLLPYLFVLSVQYISAQKLESKCPDFFQYDASKIQDDRWFGDIILSSEYALNGYWVELSLSNNVEVLGLKSDQPVTTTNNKNYVFIRQKDKIEPGKSIKIPIFVKYDTLSFPIPEVASIHINGREVCPQQTPAPVGISPCPGIFSYDSDQDEASGKWFGTINLNLEYNLRGVFLEFHLNGKADLVGNINYKMKQNNSPDLYFWEPVGEITTKDNQVYLITNRSFSLPHGEILSIPFFVKYDILGGIPLVNTVVLNGRVVCQGSFKDLPILPQIPLLFDSSKPRSVAKIHTTLKPAHSLYSSTPPTTESIDLANIPEFNEDEENSNGSGYQCGVQELSDKIIHGATTSIRKHPWHGAIFKLEKYICGMTLISRKHALTAAHCMYDQSRLPTDQTIITYRFGVDNLEDLHNRNVQIGRFSQVYIHPQYYYHKTDYDITVVEFSNELRITEYVIPVCLWSGKTSQEEIVNRAGLIVGFGQTEHGSNSNILREAKILVVDSDTCRQADIIFYAQFLSANSFCAGNISSDVLSCTGDSGGGVFFKKPGTHIWEIRGITSTTKKDFYLGCDSKVYTIYTDIAKFKDWILEILLK